MFLGQTWFGLDELLHCVAISEGIWCEYQTIVQLHHQFFLFLFLFSSSYTIQRVSIELESNSNHHLRDHKEITKSDVNTRPSLNYIIVSPFLFLFVQFSDEGSLPISKYWRATQILISPITRDKPICCQSICFL